MYFQEIQRLFPGLLQRQDLLPEHQGAGEGSRTKHRGPRVSGWRGMGLQGSPRTLKFPGQSLFQDCF